MNDKQLTAILVLGTLAAIVIFCGMCSQVGRIIRTEVPTREKQVTEFDAKMACQWFIKNRLVSPGSADFVDSAEVKRNGEEWIVQGQVDSQNKFGGLMRSHYLCVMEYRKSDNNWVLTDSLVLQP